MEMCLNNKERKAQKEEGNLLTNVPAYGAIYHVISNSWPRAAFGVLAPGYLLQLPPDVKIRVDQGNIRLRTKSCLLTISPRKGDQGLADFIALTPEGDPVPTMTPPLPCKVSGSPAKVGHGDAMEACQGSTEKGSRQEYGSIQANTAANGMIAYFRNNGEFCTAFGVLAQGHRLQLASDVYIKIVRGIIKLHTELSQLTISPRKDDPGLAEFIALRSKGAPAPTMTPNLPCKESALLAKVGPAKCERESPRKEVA